ncbi:MAG: hypothetical protein R3B84_06825 [Zavarzinella sp.]
MNPRVLNMGMLILWVVISIGLLTRAWWMPAQYQHRFQGERIVMVMGVVIMLIIWNLIKVFGNRIGKTKGKTAHQEFREKYGKPKEIENPEFNFTEDQNKSEAK